MKSFMFVPVVNHFELLESAVRSVKPALFDEYIIFNNSEKEVPTRVHDGTPFVVWTPERRMTFLETQNIMRAYAIDGGFDFFSFMHNDGQILDDTDERVVTYAESTDDGWGAIFTRYDVFCAFNTEAVIAAGEWGDSLWPTEQHSGYYLDLDYYRRVEHAGFPIVQLGFAGVAHVESATILDAGESETWAAVEQRVIAHYVEKWGGLPHEEIVEVLPQRFRLPPERRWAVSTWPYVSDLGEKLAVRQSSRD